MELFFKYTNKISVVQKIILSLLDKKYLELFSDTTLNYSNISFIVEYYNCKYTDFDLYFKASYLYTKNNLGEVIKILDNIYYNLYNGSTEDNFEKIKNRDIDTKLFDDSFFDIWLLEDPDNNPYIYVYLYKHHTNLFYEEYSSRLWYVEVILEEKNIYQIIETKKVPYESIVFFRKQYNIDYFGTDYVERNITEFNNIYSKEIVEKYLDIYNIVNVVLNYCNITESEDYIYIDNYPIHKNHYIFNYGWSYNSETQIEERVAYNIKEIISRDDENVISKYGTVNVIGLVKLFTESRKCYSLIFDESTKFVEEEVFQNKKKYLQELFLLFLNKSLTIENVFYYLDKQLYFFEYFANHHIDPYKYLQNISEKPEICIHIFENETYENLKKIVFLDIVLREYNIHDNARHFTYYLIKGDN